VASQPKAQGFRIEHHKQVKVLESTVCQEIVDLVGAAGPSSVRQIAGLMGRRPDSLYYHVHKLVAAGLLIQHGVQGAGRNAESVYDVPGRPLFLAYDPQDADNVGAISRVVASMLRSALRDFRSGFKPELAVVEGEGRNLWAARMKGWLSAADVAELNRLLMEILELFHRNGDPGDGAGAAERRPGPSRRLHTFTWLVAPMDRDSVSRSDRDSA
jgi:hypothetical protein